MATIARDVILCTMKLAVLGLKVLFYQCYNFWPLARASASYPDGREFLGAVSGPQVPSALSLRRVGLHPASKYHRP